MLPPVLAAGAIIACSAAMLKAVELARRLAPLPRPILLVGQSGVGKGLLARFIHVQSARAGDFVAVAGQPQEIGRGAGRGRREMSGGAGSFKKKKNKVRLVQISLNT